jgi:hypothetical protein
MLSNMLHRLRRTLPPEIADAPEMTDVRPDRAAQSVLCSREIASQIEMLRRSVEYVVRAHELNVTLASQRPPIILPYEGRPGVGT